MKSIAEVEAWFDELEKLLLADQVEKLREISKSPDATIVLTSGRCRKWMLDRAHIILED